MFSTATEGKASLARARACVRTATRLAGWLSLWLVFSAVLSPAGAAWAARPVAPVAPIFTVNNTADVVAAAPLNDGICATAYPSGHPNGVCTLRAAIMKANHWPGGGVQINLPALAPGAVYTLTIPASGSDDEDSGDLNIKANVTIIGGGASRTIIDGNAKDNVFNVYPVALTLIGVTVQGGKNVAGGGIINVGTLTVTRSTVRGNQGGGGIFNAATLTVSNSTVSGNQGGAGGGLYNLGTAMVIDSTVSGNQSQFGGGGIINNGTLTVVNSTVSGNQGGAGGGLYNTGPLTVTNSTISTNLAAADGGGIYNSNASSLALFNVTVADNMADSDLDGVGTGGGIFNNGGTAQLQNSLLSGNTASTHVFNVYLAYPNDCSGSLTSNDYNLVSITTGCAFGAINNDQTNVDPILGPLQYNGGSTRTHALLLGSPAINAGNLGGCNDDQGLPLATDQRGWARIVGNYCDIGAYEAPWQVFLPFIHR